MKAFFLPLLAAWGVLSLASISLGQDQRFTFDGSGNLVASFAASLAAPEIISQPQLQVVRPGELASFFVVAADTRGLAYQWRTNGINLTGATNDALLLTNVSALNVGLYSVVLSNSSGSVTSAAAMLWLDADGDELADTWEQSYFAGLAQNPGSDSDGDGVSNLDEFRDGTNPTNSASALFRLTLLSDGGQVVVTPSKLSYTNGEIVTLTATAFPSEIFHGWTGATISRTNPLTLVMNSNKTLFANFQPRMLTWVGAASSSWHNPSNWNPTLVPTAVDTVTIPVGTGVASVTAPAECRDLTLNNGSLTVDSDLTVPALTFSGGSLSGTGLLTVSTQALWTAGSMSGTGRTLIGPAATLTLANPGDVSMSRTLDNAGTVVWTNAGGINCSSGVITNRAGALWHCQNAASFFFVGGAVGRFDNAGTFRKSVSVGTTTFANNVNFNNYGMVEIQTGTLSFGSSLLNAGLIQLSPGTTNRIPASGSATGVFTNPSTALVEWTGTFTFNPGAQLNGSGLYRLSVGSLAVNTDVTIQNLDMAGSISGSGILTVSNALNWTAGTMSGTGRTLIGPAATLTLANPSDVSMGRTLDNAGTVVWTGAGSLNCQNGVITNRAGALWHCQNAASFYFVGGVPGRFDNAGTFRKSVSTGTTTINNNVNFNNYGSVDIRSGILSAIGNFISSSSAALNCALGGTTAGTGYGQLQKSGTITLAGALSVDLLPGFTPATNDTFTVVTAGTRSGTNSSFTYPVNRVTMQLSNSPNSVILRVTDVFPIPQPMLLTPLLSGSNALLTWTATSNVTYRLEFNPIVSSTNWTAVPGDVTTVSNTASKLDALTSSNRFYRVRVLP